MTATATIGLIGYGLAGSAFHAPLIASTPGLNLAAIVTSDSQRRRQASERHPGTRILATVAELWDTDLDCVVVATPNSSHAELAHQVIDHGLATVVDKPMAVTAADATELVQHAVDREVLLSPYQNRRWDGDYLTVAQLVRNGDLGDVSRFESCFERWRPQVGHGWKESPDPKSGGGILLDLGPHLIDQAIQLFGSVSHVYAEVDTRRVGALVDDDTFVALTHDNGTRSHLWMSATAAAIGPRFRVLGSSAGYTVSGLDPQEAALRSGQLPGPGWGRVPRSEWGTLTVGDSTDRVPTIPGDYPAFYARLSAALNHGTEPPVDPNDAVTTLRIIEAARQSSRTQATVRLGGC